MMDTRVEGNPNSMPKPSATINGEKYNLRSGKRSDNTLKPSGYTLRSGKPANLKTHKDWTLPAGSENWEKAKSTGRRSGVQQRPNTESHLSPSESHGFRSNIPNKNHAASPTKGKGSRAFDETCPNVSLTSPTFDSRQQTGGSNSCKHSFSTPVIHCADLEDMGSWLKFEDDSLPDIDTGNYLGLSVPIDNLDDLDEIFCNHRICSRCNRVFNCWL
ncbi:uncharacterized protein LOC131077848 isoform X2 [Cryptomeria japonica]|uniref:uncharacterized protein LOC131077848 isoform X2 n=1 Tax=Cryptomeria japonica TaxID=3369 RepID=UPI0027DA53BC|nr:uncharacterized protein LOC131077848 isoform X2 [Cryptomeria japonica]